MLQPGHTIGDMYRIERLIGSGGMADVYLVKHVRLPKYYALKVLRVGFGDSPGFRERFYREAEILATLRHDHLVSVFDRNELPDGSPFLVMELLEGEDLSQFLTRAGGPLNIPVALGICQQIGEALHAAHQAGIVHRDLKPSNIFLCQREGSPNFVKVLDFGIAKQTQLRQIALTMERTPMGTPGYMAPEQVRGDHEQVDHRTDQFALAGILYEMLSGQPAFYRPNEPLYVTLLRVVDETPVPLSHPIINSAVQRALSKKTADRYPSIREFLTAVGAAPLSAHLAKTAVVAPKSTMSSGQVMTRWQTNQPVIRRIRIVVSASLSILLMIGVCFTGIQWKKHQHPASPVLSEERMNPTLSTPMDLAPSSAVANTWIIADSPDLAPAAPELGGSDLGGPDLSSPTLETEKAVRPPIVKPARPGTVPARHPVPIPRSYSMSDVMPAQEQLLRRCTAQGLDEVSGLNNAVIKLERTGALQITEAPSQVFQSNFGYCLRKVFDTKDIALPVPKMVIIRVHGGK